MNKYEGGGPLKNRQIIFRILFTGEPVLEQLVHAVHETAAVKMLRAMGWKPGQGAGERVSKKEKKRVGEQRRVYGCYMPDELRQVREC